MNTPRLIDGTLYWYRNYGTSNQFRVHSSYDESAQLIDGKNYNISHDEFVTCGYCYLNVPHSINLHKHKINTTPHKIVN